MDWNPILKRFIVFNENRIMAELMLTLGVNEPLT